MNPAGFTGSVAQPLLWLSCRHGTSRPAYAVAGIRRETEAKSAGEGEGREHSATDGTDGHGWLETTEHTEAILSQEETEGTENCFLDLCFFRWLR